MSAQRTRGDATSDAQMSRLLLEILREGRPDSELLARFALDPESLTRGEHAEVEAHLAAAPHHGDPVRVVQSFSYLSSGAVPSDPVRAEPTRWRPRWRPVWRPVGLVGLGGLAAAVALGVGLLTSPEPSPEGGSPGGMPTLAPEARVVADATPSGVRASGSGESAPARPADRPPLPAPAAVPGPRSTPVGVERAASSDAPARSASSPAADGTATDGTATDGAATEGAPADTTPSGGAGRESGEAPEPSGSVLLAQIRMPSYRPPADAARRTRVSGTVRSDASALELTALAPDHVARTLRESPTLLWALTGDAPVEGSFGLVLLEPDSEEPLFDGAIEPPARAGLQRIDLVALGVALPPEVEIVWSVVFSPDPRDPSRDQVATGWIRRLSVERAGTLEPAPVEERAAVYARQGLWYDALALLDDLRREHPRDLSLRKALESLLRQGGVQEASLLGD